MIYLERPPGFDTKLHVSSCYIQVGRVFLFLHRHPDIIEGGKWGIPAGKGEEEECALDAVMREVLQETGIRLTRNEVWYAATVFIRYPEFDFAYHMFWVRLVEKPEVVLNPKEGVDFRWITLDEALSLDLIRDEDGCIRIFQEFLAQKAVR